MDNVLVISALVVAGLTGSGIWLGSASPRHLWLATIGFILGTFVLMCSLGGFTDPDLVWIDLSFLLAPPLLLASVIHGGRLTAAPKWVTAVIGFIAAWVSVIVILFWSLTKTSFSIL